MLCITCFLSLPFGIFSSPFLPPFHYIFYFIVLLIIIFASVFFLLFYFILIIKLFLSQPSGFAFLSVSPPHPSWQGVGGVG